MTYVTDLYFECHITIDPVFGERRVLAEEIAKLHKFKVAKLLMDKGVPSELDTFMTGHATNYDDLQDRMVKIIKNLNVYGYNVRRYKIEDTLLDSRPQHDPLGLLKCQKITCSCES